MLRRKTLVPDDKEWNRPAVYRHEELVALEDDDDLFARETETVSDEPTVQRPIPDLVDAQTLPDRLDELVKVWLRRRSAHAQAAIGEADLADLVSLLRARS